MMDYNEFSDFGDDYDDSDDYSLMDGFDAEDDMERIEDECGYDPDFPGICHHVGSEHCSFWCPLHHVYFAPNKPADDLPF